MDRAVELIMQWFPMLATDVGFKVTSPVTRKYNCIAWSLKKNDCWVWPVVPQEREVDMFWRNSCGYDDRIETFMSFYHSLGFVETQDGRIEDGFDKIALYAKDGLCTHAALMLPSGLWTSKLGPYHDIQHSTPAVLEGPVYGTVACYMKKIQNQ